MERYAYTPYGEVTFLDAFANPLSPQRSTVGNSYTFTGRRWAMESGQYYYRARYYCSVVARFLCRDSQGYADGPNLYAPYLVSLGALDPSGKGCIVYYNCRLVRIQTTGTFVKECIYASVESTKPRKELAGVGVVACNDPRIPKAFELPIPTMRYLCRCPALRTDYAQLWDKWGVFFDCSKSECIKHAKDTAKKAKGKCALMPPGPKAACKAFWKAWEQGMIALCSKCKKP